MAEIPVGALVTAITGANSAIAGAREALQRSHAAGASTKVMKDDLAAEMSRAEAMIAAAVDRPAVLARDQLFEVDMDVLASRMRSMKATLAEHVATSFIQRLFCGDIPDEFLLQNKTWIQGFLAKWQVKMNELMSMTPAEVDAYDFARARAIFVRPFLLVADNGCATTDSSHELADAIEDMQLSAVTGLLYKRGTHQEQVLRDIGFSLTYHRFKTRKYNTGRDKVVAKMSALAKDLKHCPTKWFGNVTELRTMLNGLLPHDLCLLEADCEDSDAAEDSIPLSRVHVLAAPSCDDSRKEQHSCILGCCMPSQK